MPRRRDDARQRHSRFNAESMQHVEKILSREIPRCTRGERTSAQTACRGIKCRDAELYCGKHICQRRSARIVKVKRDLVKRYSTRGESHQAYNLRRCSNPNGIAEHDLIHLEVA